MSSYINATSNQQTDFFNMNGFKATNVATTQVGVDPTDSMAFGQLRVQTLQAPNIQYGVIDNTVVFTPTRTDESNYIAIPLLAFVYFNFVSPGGSITQNPEVQIIDIEGNVFMDITPLDPTLVGGQIIRIPDGIYSAYEQNISNVLFSTVVTQECNIPITGFCSMMIINNIRETLPS
jgi:hypothetical protein